MFLREQRESLDQELKRCEARAAALRKAAAEADASSGGYEMSGGSLPKVQSAAVSTNDPGVSTPKSKRGRPKKIRDAVPAKTHFEIHPDREVPAVTIEAG